MAIALQGLQTTEYKDVTDCFQASLGVQCIATKTNKWREFYSKDLDAEWQQARTRSNVYWTPNSFKNHQRGIDSIVQLNAFYVDLDCYKLDMTKEIALHSLNMVLKDNNIFKPTLIIDSGNGLQLLWRIEGVPVRSASVIKLWNRIEKELAKRLAILGADPASTDASRVLRVPDTYNTKGKDLQLTEVVAFDRKAIYEMRDFQFELLPDLPKKGPYQEKERIKKAPNKERRKASVSRLFNPYTLNKARLTDLETLLTLRDYQPTDMRNIIMFLMANFIENGDLGIDKEQYLTDMNNSLKTPLNKREIATIIRNTDGKYNYKSSTLIELLQVTEEEQKQMKTLLSDNEYNRRQRIARNKRYEPIKQANKSKKEERDMMVKDLSKNGYTQKEIAKKLEIGQSTVSRILQS